MTYCSVLDCSEFEPCQRHAEAPLMVFIFAGQSNCVGRGVAADLPQGLLEAVKNVQLFHYSAAPGGFLATSHGTWNEMGIQHSEGERIEFFGPELSLGAALAQYSHQEECSWRGRRIGIIKFGVGSTSISVWKKSGELFQQFTSHVSLALGQLKNVEIGGFFWFQGESDSSNSSHSKHHEAALRELVQHVREHVNRPQLPVVVSEVVWKGSHLNTVNAGIRRVGNEAPGLNAWTSSVGLTTFDDGHLDSWSLLEVGSRMTHALVTLEKFKTQAVIPRSDWIALSSVWEGSQPRCQRYGTLRDFPLWAAQHAQRYANVSVVSGRDMSPSLSVPSRIFAVSWNVLSQTWLDKSETDYKECLPEHLSWKNRLASILSWINSVAPDIVMLQEVDYDVFESDFLLPLRAAGYEGLLQKPKKVSPEQPCGCASFWRASKFTLIPDAVKQCSRALALGLNLASGGQLWVLNVHLESKQESMDARARQLSSALEFAAKTIPSAPLILGGDFNTGADSSLLRTLREEQWNGFGLASAYEHPAALGTTAATLCTLVFPNVRYMIDHMLYTHESLKLHALWQCLLPDEFKSSIGHRPNGLPDALIPSDHIPIGAVFEFVGGGEVAEQKEELSEEDKTALRIKWKELMVLAPLRGKGKPTEQELIALREHAGMLKEFKASLSPSQLSFIQKEEKAKK